MFLGYVAVDNRFFLASIAEEVIEVLIEDNDPEVKFFEILTPGPTVTLRPVILMPTYSDSVNADIYDLQAGGQIIATVKKLT